MDEEYKKTIESYNKTIKKYNQLTKEIIPFEKLNTFLKYFNNENLILDVGCGTGRQTELISKKYRVIGIDLSEKMIKYSKKLFPQIDFQIQDMLSTNFNNETFNGIWANASFLHIKKKDVDSGIKEINRILKQNGIMFISFKTGNHEEVISDQRYDGVEKFFSYYEYEEVKNILENNNFKIIDGEEFKPKENYNISTNYINIYCKKIK